MTLQSRSKLLLASFLGSSALVLASLFVLDHERLTEVYHTSGFLFLFVSFTCWLLMMLPRQASQARLRSLFRQHGLALALAILLPGLMCLVSAPQFRILEDETNLLGVANSMFSKHSFANMNNTFFHSHAQHEVGSQWDIRPNFFPFLIYIVHSLRGYSAYNGFVVNYAAGAASLWSLYWLLRQWFRKDVAVLGLLTLAAFPVFVLWVTSSGFEILNLAMCLIAFCMLYRYLQSRESYDLERLMLTLLLLAQTRYESSIFALAFGLVVLASLRTASIQKLSFRLVAAPCFFLPVAWQRLLKSAPEEYQVFGQDVVFGLGNWTKNVRHAWDYFAAGEARYGTIGVVFYLSLLGLALGVALALRRRQPIAASTWSMLSAALLSLAALSGVVFAYFWGDLTVSFTIRLGIIFLPFVIFGFCFFVEWLTTRSWVKAMKHLGTQSALVLGLALCTFHWPTAARNEAVLELTLNRQYQSSLSFLKTHYPEHNNLIITDRPGLYSVHRWGSVTNKFANRNLRPLTRDLKRRLYQNILTIQLINYQDGSALQGTSLNPNFVLESLFETQFNEESKLVISRVLVE